MNPCVPLMLTQAELKHCLKVAGLSTRDEIKYALDNEGEECNLWECEWAGLSRDLRKHADKKGTLAKDELRALAFKIDERWKRC